MIAKLLRCTRRNHALEHATITLLSQCHPQARLMGISGPRGFTLYTNLTAEEVFPAVNDALRRLKAGQRALAIQPNCVTTLLTAATLTTVTAYLGLGNSHLASRERRERFPQVILLNALMILLSRPLGAWLQANVTVDAALGGAEITSILTDYHQNYRRIRIQVKHT